MSGLRSSAIAVAAALGMASGAQAQTVINNQTVTVPPNTIPNDNLIVGSTGVGTLNIISGGIVASTSGVIADQANSTGTVSVLGTGTWTITNGLQVGRYGSGVLNLTGGGQVSSNGVYVGDEGDASGTVNIDGDGSTLTSTSSVYVSSGENTSGVINVTNGGHLDASGEYMYIGEYNDGTLNVSGGSTVTSGFTYLGYCGGSCYDNNPLGTANISGAGTTWTLSDGMYIGYEYGRGQLNITAGAVVTTEYIYAGYYEGYPGGIVVSGAGSQLIVDDGSGGGNVYLGYEGNSTTTVSNGGLFQIGGDAYIGYYPTAVSTVTITGADSAMTVGGNAHIGYEGLGTVTISNGGSLSITGTTYIGEDDYFTTPASLTVTGTGSQLTAGDVEIATSSDALGAMTVANGADVQTDDVYVGRGAGATGTLNISGANTIWAGNPSLYAGYEGAGTININGGMVFDPDNNYLNYLYIAYAAGSEGTVNISGAGTVVNINNYIELGYGDRGVLNITGGASVTADYLYGATAGAPSDLLVSGAGTSLNIYYGAYIGNNATLNAIIENGAQLNATDTSVQINYDSVLEVRNGAQVTAANGIIIGGSTNGTMILSTGSTATATNGIVRIAQTGGNGTLIFGAREGDAPVAAGTLNSAQVTFGNTFSVPSLSGEIVFNHTGSMTFGSALSVLNGTGHELTVLAGTTTFTGNSSAFTGDMTVTGGKAVVNSNYSQTDVTVSGTGIVGGDGTIASLDVQSGGTVAPGNSPGTLNVVGNLSFAAGTNYEVEVAGAQSDLILAGGTATIAGGTVQVSGSPSLMRYAIITSTGARTGEFDGVDTTSAFILYSLDYDPNNVYLVVDGYNALTTAARTPNEYAVANALDKFPTDNPLYSSIVAGGVAGAQQAFNALSGEIHASVGSALADDSRYVREAITGRLIQSYYGGIGAGGGQPIVMAAAAPTNVVETDSSSRMSLGAGYGASRGAPPVDHDLAWWSRAFGAWGQYDSNGNAATTDRNLGGFVTGVDGNMGSGWRGGLATGYLNTSLSAAGDRYSSADINSYVLGAYAGGGIGEFALRSGGTWTWNSIESDRSVVFPGFFEGESASYNGDVGQLFAELAYPIFTHGGVIEPFAGLAYVHVGTDSFTESGPIAGLTSGGLNMNLGYGTLGARAGTTVVWGGTTVIPHVSAAWQYAFGDTTPEIAMAFVSTGIGIGIGGVPLAQNSALLDIGADAVIAQDMTLGLSYMGQYSGDFTDNGLRGRFNWKF